MGTPQKSRGRTGLSRPRRNALKDAVREARIEAAERSAVVVDLHDAELARLELLNEALDPLFDDVPADVELFDRGISRGDVPRLWIDVIAHIEMGRDKRQYRFVQDTRYGRAVLAESYERAGNGAGGHPLCRAPPGRARARAGRRRAVRQATSQKMVEQEQRRGRLRAIRTFIYGVIIAVAALFVLALLNNPNP